MHNNELCLTKKSALDIYFQMVHIFQLQPMSSQEIEILLQFYYIIHCKKSCNQNLYHKDPIQHTVVYMHRLQHQANLTT